MKPVTEIQAELANFYGTEAYYRLGFGAVLTDGTKYLAEAAECFWLFQDTAIHLRGYQRQDHFAVIELRQTDNGFEVTLGDGNDHWNVLFAGKYTSFPKEMMSFRFYAVWQNEVGWVLMLTTEY